MKKKLKKIEKELEADRMDYDKLLKKAMAYSKQVFDSLPDAELFIDGEEQLLETPEFSESQKFKDLIEAIEEKSRLLHFLDRCLEGEGVKIFIGSETKVRGMDSVGVVGAPYTKDGKVVGVLGIIGPMRMDYSRVVPIVDFTAKVLGDMLEV